MKINNHNNSFKALLIDLTVEKIIYKGPANGFWKYNNFVENIGQLATYSYNNIILHTIREGEARIEWKKEGKIIKVTLANDSKEIIQKTKERILEAAEKFKRYKL